MPIDPRELEIGNRFPNTKWVVRGKLGEGGMGVVLEVVKPPGIVGAMKIMRPDLADQREYIDSFLNEVRLQVSLQHEHIVRIIDFDELDDGTLYFVMEVLIGSTLRQTMRNFGKPLPPPHVHEIICQVSEALDRAHSANVVHRDLKPENVFLHAPEGSRATIKVGDFGIAVLGHGKRARGVFGTPKYMSPEQFRGDRVTPRTDIYAMGLMTYEMLTGRLPWDLPDDTDKMRHLHLHAEPIPPIKFAPWISESTNLFILSAIAKKPEDRPRDAVEFSNRLFDLQFCAGSSTALDINSTEPSLSTLAGLVTPNGEGERSKGSGGTETARGMTPPPMEGRSLELAPAAATVTEPIPAPNAPARLETSAPPHTPTRPVAGSAWPAAAPSPPPPLTPPPPPEEHAPLAQSTGGTSNSVASGRQDLDVVTISRKTVRRALIAVPIGVAAVAALVALPFLMRSGSVPAASEPAAPGSSLSVVAAVPVRSAATEAPVAVVATAAPAPPTASATVPASMPTAPAALPVAPPPRRPGETVAVAAEAPATGSPLLPRPLVFGAEAPTAPTAKSPPPPPPPTASAKPPPKPAPDDGNDLLSMPKPPR